VLAVNTSDIVIKKMVFQYLTQHAHSHPDIAILCINTLKTDCSANEDPMIRGLALRSLCSLRLESMLEYLLEPLQACLRDVSPYVRKTAVMGVLKVYTLSPETVKESDFIDQLYTMIKDKDASVVTNCLMALNEIMADEGGMATNQQVL
jgi:vesicle coat complex subunit